MNDIADLEISLHQRDPHIYTAEVRFSQPGSDADIRLGQERPVTLQFDFTDLLTKSTDPQAYGAALTKSLFADAELTKLFAQARASAQTAKSPLRVRFVIGPSAPELNALYWEALRDPEDEKAPLFTGEQIYFSRYLSSLDWRPVRLRPKGALRALVAIANPSGLDKYSLAAVDVAGELQRARQSLGEIPITPLPGSEKEHCTLDSIITHLREGYDILYIVAHGAYVKEEPWLWLEDETGAVARLSGHDLVVRIRELENQPRLIVLASCQSAGQGSGAALQALGPRLTEAGVAAVVAMQGSVSMDTIAKFMPVFFSELQKDGQIDRAMSIARGAARDCPDFWMPVLFMRLKSGRIWYTPGFGEEDDFKKWPSILSSLQSVEEGQGGNCTPILGPALTEPYFGSWSDLASNLAEKYDYPLRFFHRDAMPQVTQFLAVDQDVHTLQVEFAKLLRKSLQTRWNEALPEALRSEKASLKELIRESGHILRASQPLESHRILASLPLPLYITTNYDNLMADALREAGKDPQVVICPWSDRFVPPDSIYTSEPQYRPDEKRPLVYHLFGHLDVPDSLVLTEDDYFEFLIGVTANKALIPPMVLRRLADTALLFLGFQLDDWQFRIIFRALMASQGSSRRGRYTHVAVQVDPDESRNINPKRARDFLKDYFDDASISIYWGQAADFLRELKEQMESAR